MKASFNSRASPSEFIVNPCGVPLGTPSFTVKTALSIVSNATSRESKDPSVATVVVAKAA